jgi:hypothetical protein
MKPGHFPTTVAAAFAVVAAGLGGAGALAAPPPGTVQTLRFVERAEPHGGGFFDAPPAATGENDASPGDAFFFTSKLYSPKGRKIGRDQGTCTFLDKRGFVECSATVIFPKGSVILHAGLRFSNGPGGFTVAVIGGTGAFEGVRGSALIAERPGTNGNVSDFTMRLIR